MVTFLCYKSDSFASVITCYNNKELWMHEYNFCLKYALKEHGMYLKVMCMLNEEIHDTCNVVIVFSETHVHVCCL